MNNAKQIIEDFFIEREGEGVLADLYQVNLFNSGLMDSLDVVTLIVYIEKKCGVQLKMNEALTFEAFNTAQGIIDLIQRKQQAE